MKSEEIRELKRIKKEIEKENRKAKFIGFNPFEGKEIIFEKVPAVNEELADFILEGRRLFKKWKKKEWKKKLKKRCENEV